MKSDRRDLWMSFDRSGLGLSHFSSHLYSHAAEVFAEALATESKSEKKKSVQVRYYHAVSMWGALLDSLTKESKSQNKAASIRDLFAKQDTSHTQDNKDESADYDNNLRTIAVLKLFESLKLALQPKSYAGVEYAIITLNQQLYTFNQSANKQQHKRFAIELAKFKLLYSTKLRMIDDLESVDNSDESFFSRLFSSDNTAKKLQQILNADKTDPLFLTPEQLSELYKLWQHYQYDKKYDSLFTHLEKQLLLVGFVSTDDGYKNFWKKFKDTITLDKVAVIRQIYDDTTLRELRPVLDELHNNGLLTDQMIVCLQTIVLSRGDYRQDLATIDTLISGSQAINKGVLQTKLCETLLGRMSHPSIPDRAFQRYISHVKDSCTLAKNGGMNFKKIYRYLDLLTLLTDKNIPLDKVADLMGQVESVIGKKSFSILCKKILTYKISAPDFIAIMNATLQLREESADDLFKLIDDHHDDIPTLRHRLNEIVMRDYYLKFPERSLEEVTHDFLTPSSDIEYTLDPAEFNEHKERYLRIKSMGDELLAAGEIGIQSALSKCKAALRNNLQDKDAQITLLAIIRLQIKSLFGINPYNIQMLNVLALLNQPKRIAQIKTGEGKSTLIAILSAYYALIGHKVDIITTSHDLAIRDAKKYKEFYNALGLKSGHNVSEGNQDNSSCYGNNVLYGTVADFEFAFLRKETGQSEGRGDRPYDVVIADEVDSMFIDMQRNEAILSQATEATYGANVYRDIWEWVNDAESKEQTSQNLQAMLKAKNVNIDLELAKTWLKSARSAQRFNENEEYIVDYPSKKKKSSRDERVIKIVNKSHTGEVQSESTRWQGGLHQFLEAKHKLKIRTESLTSASISHIEFFNKYKMLVGLTGTLGSQSCRDELQKLYHVSTYDSPPYKPSRKKPVPHVIVTDEKDHINAIIKVVKNEIKAGRPVLILCESIQDSQMLYEYLSKDIDSVSIYNGVQEESAEEILGLAGNARAVTIATNLAGRGTDIVVTPEAEANGGLHVVVTFPALNRRVEQQAFGRTGRQGRQGTFHYVLHEDQLSDQENEAKNIDEKIQIMREVREKREEYLSQTNMFNYSLMHKLFILQHVFFSLPDNVKDATMAAWAKFKTSAHKYTVQYLRDELETIDENDVFQKVLTDFSAFWQEAIACADPQYGKLAAFIHLRLKQEFPDDYSRKLLIQALVLLDNPEFDFSTAVSDLVIEMKTEEWGLDKIEMEPEFVEEKGGISKLMQFYRPSTSKPPKDEKAEPSTLMKGFRWIAANLKM